MKTYKQVLETVELALAKGEYRYCIEFVKISRSNECSILPSIM